MAPLHDVEQIPADFDRFVGNFFDRRGWRSALKYDAAADLLYLEVRVASRKLSRDDRFFSLIEYFARAQDALARQTPNHRIRYRVYAIDGADLTTLLHARGSSYLDDDRRGTGMRRRLLWLSFRRRFVARLLPNGLAWTAALVFVVAVIGVRFETAVLIALGAVLLQGFVLATLAPRRH